MSSSPSERGPAPRVVLVHGIRDDARSFDEARRHLTDLDVVAYHRRGWAPGSIERPTELAAHVEDLVTLLGERPSVVIGHSWGGNVALAAATERPDLVTAVGVYETAMFWMEGWPEGHRDLVDGTMDKVGARPDGTPRQVQHRALFVIEAGMTRYPTFELDRPRPPCTVAHGSASGEFFRAGMRRAAELLGAELVVIEGAGHMAHREDPEGFARFVRTVVATAAPTAAADRNGRSDT